jgi:1,4-alpha-glucan branching enzyme
MIKRTTKMKNTSNRTAFSKAAAKPEPAKVQAAKATTIHAKPDVSTTQPVTVKAQPPKAQIKLVKPDAKAVCVAGSFNEWNPARTPLTRVDNGTWIGEITGISGRHEYLFVVDGQWLPDPNAPETVQNPFGGRNSVMIVSE